jgi:hypothetical protein
MFEELDSVFRLISEDLQCILSKMSVAQTNTNEFCEIGVRIESERNFVSRFYVTVMKRFRSCRRDIRDFERPLEHSERQGAFFVPIVNVISNIERFSEFSPAFA